MWCLTSRTVNCSVHACSGYTVVYNVQDRLMAFVILCIHLTIRVPVCLFSCLHAYLPTPYIYTSETESIGRSIASYFRFRNRRQCLVWATVLLNVWGIMSTSGECSLNRSSTMYTPFKCYFGRGLSKAWGGGGGGSPVVPVHYDLKGRRFEPRGRTSHCKSPRRSSPDQGVGPLHSAGTELSELQLPVPKGGLTTPVWQLPHV